MKRNCPFRNSWERTRAGRLTLPCEVPRVWPPLRGGLVQDGTLGVGTVIMQQIVF